MTDHSDLVERLEALAAEPPGDLTDARRDAIEARVLDASRVGAVEARRRPVGFMLVAAAAIIAIVLAVAAVRPDDRGLVVSAADRVVLELADGTSTPAEAGDELADGTVIEIATGGSLVLGDGVLGPGRYEVRDGRAVPVGPIPATSTTTTPPPAADRPIQSRPSIRDSDDIDPRPSGTGTRPPTTIVADPPPPATTARTTTTAADRPADPSTTIPTTSPPTRPPTTVVDATTTTTTTTSRPLRDRPADRPTTTVGDGGDREE